MIELPNPIYLNPSYEYARVFVPVPDTTKNLPFHTKDPDEAVENGVISNPNHVIPSYEYASVFDEPGPPAIAICPFHINEFTDVVNNAEFEDVHVPVPLNDVLYFISPVLLELIPPIIHLFPIQQIEYIVDNGIPAPSQLMPS
jgi:hypothetical protein